MNPFSPSHRQCGNCSAELLRRPLYQHRSETLPNCRLSGDYSGEPARRNLPNTLNLRLSKDLDRWPKLARPSESTQSFDPFPSGQPPSGEPRSCNSSSAATLLSSSVSSSSLAVLRLSRVLKADDRTARRRFSLCWKWATESSNSATCAFSGAIWVDCTPQPKMAAKTCGLQQLRHSAHHASKPPRPTLPVAQQPAKAPLVKRHPGPPHREDHKINPGGRGIKVRHANQNRVENSHHHGQRAFCLAPDHRCSTLLPA